MKHSDWAEHLERSNFALLRLTTWPSLRFRRSFDRVLLRLTALCFAAASPAVRDVSHDHLHRALSHTVTLCNVLRHMLTFATAIYDRIYLISGRFGLFDIQLQDRQHVHNVLAQGHDVFLLDTHLGSLEVVHAFGRTVPDPRVAVTMHEENTRNISATVAAINLAAALEVIPLGRVDAILQVREVLDDNRLVGMLANRVLLRDAGPSVQRMDFLSSPAAFPLRSLYMTTTLRRPVLFMAGLHLGDNHYAVHLDLLTDFTDVRHKDCIAVMRAALGHYVGRVEHYCRTTLHNQFDYSDFWQDADMAGAPDHAPADHWTTRTP